MYQVKCPHCLTVREVKHKKPWMDGEQPFERLCKSCCQIGKNLSSETKEKLSQIASELQTPERRAKMSNFMKSHPERWQGKVATGAGGGWNKGKQLTARSDETKAKISQTMKQRKGKGERSES